MNHNLKIPDDVKLKNVKKLCLIDAPYELNNEVELIFLEAMKEIVLWHKENSTFYNNLLENENFKIENIKKVEDLIKIPHVWAHFFKTHELMSINKEDVYLHLTSSGTTGQKSQIFFDEWTIKSAQKMVDEIFNYYEWTQENSNTNYILFSYETNPQLKLGTAYTDNFLCKYAKVNKVFSALRMNGNGGHDFDCFGTIDKYFEYEKDGLPVRLFGFPAFLYFSLERMKKLGLPKIKLNQDSFVFLGGGWKGNSNKSIDKKELYDLIEEMLGIPNERIRDGFGSVEHCIPYVECKNHEFHIPVWSKVFIRDINDLSLKSYGEQGFLHFISPYITSVPAHSVIMGDLASLHRAEECGCEIKTPFFKIAGRAGTSKNKSCAVHALELLKDHK